jgi:nucleoside-diphosphate-sugar epimerase
MKISITGATGFVGSNLKKLFKSKYEIEDIHVRYIPDQKIKIDSDAIIHLAGKAHDLKKSNEKEYLESNYELTKQLFDEFLINDSEVFIFMSTVKAVGDEFNNLLTEEEEPHPETYYGKSKLLAENYILSHDLQKNKRVYILRPTIIYGPGNKGNLNLLFKLVSKGLPWPLGSFENQRSYCSIDNLSFVIKQILENKEIPTGIYNVCDDKTLSTNQLIEIISTTLDKKARVLKISKKLIYAFAKLGDFFKLPLNTETLKKLTNNFIVSNYKIKKSLGLECLPISTKEGMIKTFKTF